MSSWDSDYKHATVGLETAGTAIFASSSFRRGHDDQVVDMQCSSSPSVCFQQMTLKEGMLRHSVEIG